MHRRTGRVTLTRQDRQAAAAPDLIGRDFTATAPNLRWSADITYVPTQEGWLYPAVVLDLFSRRIVGWAMADHMRTELVTDALAMAVTTRRPLPGLIHERSAGHYGGTRRPPCGEDSTPPPHTGAFATIKTGQR
ncbi:DDE-type integrase/transposase/recombinase [Streptomyces sp. NPDC059680]|uniref:DDE-type integrase/transposase/recombinase n=1 Tax=Streptomyces sp. NPDC059680 TaxID=3346904 RepID=UPI0036AC2F06